MPLRLAGHLAVRMVVFRRSSAWLLLSTAFFATLLVGSVLQVQFYAGSAYTQGLLHGRGSADDFVIQAPPVLKDALNGLDDLIPVATDDGYLNTSTLGIDVVVLTTSDLSRAGLTASSGRLPERADDVVVSPLVAASLDLHLNSQVSMSSVSGTEELRVTGIVVNPGVKDDATIYRRSHALAHQHVDYWIATPGGLAQLEQAAQMRAHFDSGTLSVSSNAVVVSEGRDKRPPRLVLVDFGVWISCALAVLALMSVLENLTRSARGDVRALAASGLTDRGAWVFVAGCAAILVVAGACLGSLTSAVAVRALQEQLGTWFHQPWAFHAVPFGRLAAAMSLVICVVPLFAVSRYIVVEISSSLARPNRLNRLPRFARSAALIAPGLVLAYVYCRCQPNAGIAVLLGAVGVVFLAHGLAPLSTRVVRAALPPATGRLVAEVLGRRAIPLMLGCVVSAVAAAYVVATVAPAGLAGERTPSLQPAGSLLILQVPDAEVPEIIAAYRSFGGAEPVAYGIPISKLGDIRASSSDDGGTAAPGELSFVAFGATVPTDSLVTSSELSGGLTTIAAYTDSGAGKHLAIRGTGDSRLGGNLPGALVSPHGSLAQAFKMRPSGFSLLALYGFDALSDGHQAKIRALIGRAAPAAIVSHADDSHPGARDRATGLLVSIVGSAVAIAVALAGLLSTGVALRGVRRTFDDLGHSRALRRRMSIATMVVESATVVLVLAFLGYAANSQLAAALEDRSIIVWTLPLASQGVLILSSGWWFYRIGRPVQRR